MNYCYVIGYADEHNITLCHKNQYNQEAFDNFIKFIATGISARSYVKDLNELFILVVSELIEKHGFTRLLPQAKFDLHKIRI
jgi:hypothetical protein